VGVVNRQNPGTLCTHHAVILMNVKKNPDAVADTFPAVNGIECMTPNQCFTQVDSGSCVNPDVIYW
jgi:hypothetical protein